MSEITGQVSTSIDALMQEFYIITHNLANVSTVGYKRVCNAFSKSLEARETGEETYSPGTIDLNSAFDFSQGSIVETGRPLDFALYGKGFFVIETPEGQLYTRNGMLRTNQNGQIVDCNGRTVAGEAGPIVIPTSMGPSQLYVSSDGTVQTRRFRGQREQTYTGWCELFPDVGGGCRAGYCREYSCKTGLSGGLQR